MARTIDECVKTVCGLLLTGLLTVISTRTPGSAFVDFYASESQHAGRPVVDDQDKKHDPFDSAGKAI